MNIQLEHISKSFRMGDSAPVKALNALTLTIPSGQFVVVIGPNGSGKSTLLNVLSGSVTPDAGSLRIGEKNLTGNKEFEMSKVVARVFQDPLSGTASGLTILENFRLAALRTGSKKLKIGMNKEFSKLAEEKLLLLNLGLEKKLNQPAGTLSGGQRQAMTLLMATMSRTNILLLDEPSAALDPKTSSTIMQLADAIVRDYQLTAILVTHSMKDALQYGNRLICMKEGSVFRDIPAEDKMKLQTGDLYNWFEA